MSTPTESTPPAEQPAGLAAIIGSGLEYTLTEHGPVSSLAEAAAARGVDPERLIKSLVVRRGEGDYLFVLVPGGQEGVDQDGAGVVSISAGSPGAAVVVDADRLVEALGAQLADVTYPE